MRTWHDKKIQFIRYLYNNSAMLKAKFQKTAVVGCHSCYIYLTNLTLQLRSVVVRIFLCKWLFFKKNQNLSGRESGKDPLAKNVPILNIFRPVFLIFCDAFCFFILGEGEEEGRSLEEILFKLIYFAVCRVNCHFLVLRVWIRYILKFYDKALPPITFWKFKHDKTFIFSRETQGKPKQL